MQQHLYEYFYKGFLVNVSLKLIDKTNGLEPKKRENYWMGTPKTLPLLVLFVSNKCFIIAILDWTIEP